MIVMDTPRCAAVKGDAFRILPSLPDNFAGVWCSDSPYGAHTHAKLGKERRADGARARVGLTFEALDQDQVRFLAQEAVRLSQGWIIAFTDDRSISWWGSGIADAGGQWVRTCSWVKTNPMPQLTMDRPGSGEEYIVLGHSNKRRLAWNGRTRSGVFVGSRDTDGFHANQKPLWLMQELLGLFCQPGELVLDPFLGSASTGVAALFPERVPGLVDVANAGCLKCRKALAAHAEGRPPLPSDVRFAGIESSDEALKIAIPRLQAALKGQLYDHEHDTVAGQLGR